MLDKVKSIREGIIIAGDGRHDSMGHSAKFGAYTIFCCTVPMILHFSLVQVSTNHYLVEFLLAYLRCMSVTCTPPKNSLDPFTH